jgi:hypothetical protein
MRIALIVLVTAAGVSVTIFAAIRMWQSVRRDAPRELVLGYLALMLVASAVSMLLLRAM